jgi:signal transduction histidine kinase
MDERPVLLVEDSPAHARAAEYSLTAGGFRVEVCRTLEAALARLSDAQQPAPSAIVLDLTLPDSEGVNTFDRLLAVGPPPIVVLSEVADPGLALSLIDRGAQDYLVKGEHSGAAIARSVRQAMERSRLQRERRAREEAEAAVRAQRAFVATMSHEVRTPLNAILGISELLAQTPLAPDQRKYVEIARRCGLALQGLLDNALALSRLESGLGEIPHDPFDLQSVIDDCLEAFSFSAHQKGTTLVADHAAGEIRTVVGDEHRIRQILFNLVGNAVKFTENGRVSVSVRADADRIAIEVADTGIGISRDRQAAVFERFVQAESGTTRRYGGSGLGLALCRELAVALGGDISLDSEPGRGSVFRVELPWRAEPADCAQSFAGYSALALFGDPVERRSVAARLRARGARVQEVATAIEAQRALRSDPRFDALLLDARLPEIGGIALLDWCEHGEGPRFGSPPPRRVVFLPMNHRLDDVAHCERLGALVLCKPVRWDALELALRDGVVAPTLATHAPPAYPGRRILLAEDAEENRMIAQAHLRLVRCRVETAVDGEDAVEKWRHGDFDLVLMDIHMPRVDGLEATRRIRAEEQRSGRRSVPIVAITADTQREQRDACLAAGCNAHLGKPFTQADLFAVLRQFLSSPQERPGSEELDARAEIPAELADLAEGYLNNRRADAMALLAAASSGDLADARQRGHKMKGSGSGYGFPRVSELGASIERAAEDGDVAAIERCAGMLSEYAERQLAALVKAPGAGVGPAAR